MRDVHFGELHTSALGFGCASVMGRIGRRASLHTMHAAWEGGVRLFDIARSYGYGEAEDLLGEFLQGRRADATIITKFGIHPHPQPTWRRAAKPAVRALLQFAPKARPLLRRRLADESTARRFDVQTLHASLEASLRALRTDYVDILLAHDAPATLGSQEDLVDALETIIRQGKARHIGISCTHEIATKIAAQQRSPFTVVQFPAELLQINTPFSSPASNMLYIAARPFGAPGQAEAAKRVLQKLRHAAQTPAELREKLDGNTDTLFAELAFANIWWNTPAQIIVASMLHAHHLHANISAIHQTRCTPHEAQWLRDELVRGIV